MIKLKNLINQTFMYKPKVGDKVIIDFGIIKSHQGNQVYLNLVRKIVALGAGKVLIKDIRGSVVFITSLNGKYQTTVPLKSIIKKG